MVLTVAISWSRYLFACAFFPSTMTLFSSNVFRCAAFSPARVCAWIGAIFTSSALAALNSACACVCAANALFFLSSAASSVAFLATFTWSAEAVSAAAAALRASRTFVALAVMALTATRLAVMACWASCFDLTSSASRLALIWRMNSNSFDLMSPFAAKRPDM